MWGGERFWVLACLLAGGLFLVRGMVLLTILPPGEGWDEYQHLAYVQQLRAGGETAKSGAAAVPDTLLRQLVRYPQSAFARVQLRGIPTYGYREARAGQVAEGPWLAHSVPLYQTQHAPLYYRAAATALDLSRTGDDFGTQVFRLRLLDLLLGAIAVTLIGIGIGRLLPPGASRLVVLGAVALQPLLLLNCCRVANDALAFLLGTASIVLLLPTPRHDGSRVRVPALGVALLAGFALGAAVLAKAVALCVLPFALVRLRRGSLGATALSLLVFGCGFGATAGPRLVENWQTSRGVAGIQELSSRGADGATDRFVMLAAAAWDVDWPHEISRRYLRHALWVGGWSHVPTAKPLVRLHQYLVLLGLAGMAWTVVRRRGGWSPSNGVPLGPALPLRVWGDLWVLQLGFLAGLAYHMAASQAAWGYVSTNVWYAALAFPWGSVLLQQGYLAFGHRAGWLLTALLALTFFAAEQYGWWIGLLPAYGHG